MVRPKILKINTRYYQLYDIATNTTLNAKINEVKKEVPNITNLATNLTLNEVKNKILNITNPPTTTALTAVEGQIPNVRNLVKNTGYSTKINKIENKISTDHDHGKCITTQDFNKLTSENLTARLKQANLASKSDIVRFVKKTDFDNKLKNVTPSKNELNKLSKKVKAITAKGLTNNLINKFSILNGAKYIFRNIPQLFSIHTS